MKTILTILVILTLSISVNAYAAITQIEREALIALYESTDGDNWTDNTGWKTPPLDLDGFAMPGTEGSWYGITISDNYVWIIYLINNQLSGNIPSSRPET